MYKEDIEYDKLYSKLPDTTEDLLKYLEDTKRIDFNKVNEKEKIIDNIKWEEINLVIPWVPKASPRPRQGKFGFYVKDAKKNRKRMKKFIEELDTICTRVEYTIEAYLPTPKSMSNVDTYLAEKKKIRPLQKPDWDNLAKTYPDTMSGYDSLLLDDYIINPGRVELYYSIKPRINIKIRYQEDFDCDYNRKRIQKTIAYMKYMCKEDK